MVRKDDRKHIFGILATLFMTSSVLQLKLNNEMLSIFIAIIGITITIGYIVSDTKD